MKQQADKGRSKREFSVGEWVYMKLQLYRQTLVAVKQALKFSAKYYGPYKVLTRVGQVAYKLGKPVTSYIHPVFHVSMLKKKIGADNTPLQNLPIHMEDKLL